MVPLGPSQVSTCDVGSPPTPAGEPDFLWRKSGERTPGASPWTPYLWPLVPTRWILGLLALMRSRGYFVRYAKTDLGRIFEGKYAGKHFCERKLPTHCASTPPKPSPRGEGGPAKPGRMRGRFGTQPFLVEVEKGATACRPDRLLLLPRWATRSPPHPSPSVTASPQGEASGLCSPTRKSVPNQGAYLGPVIAPQPPRCAPPR